jgi:molybdopterin/thiamine biosynthesis adenylyltransferase
MSEAPAGEIVESREGTDGRTFELPAHDEFYAQMTTRNQGLVSDAEQAHLRRAWVLIAGCGSVGGAAIEPLLRMGFEHLMLAEPDGYDLHNMNRQSVRIQDIGRNKADVFKERMLEINPYAEIEVLPDGITADNVEASVRQADVIVDAVDVTTRRPLKAKFALHERAERLRKPVVAGYDVAGLQMILVYDYRKPGTRVLHGRVRAEEVDEIEPMEFLSRVVPIKAIPYEIIPELRRQIRGERSGFPQIVYTSHLFGVLALRAIMDILAGRPVRRRIIVDVNDLMRPLGTRLRTRVARLVMLYALNNEYRRSRKASRLP